MKSTVEVASLLTLRKNLSFMVGSLETRPKLDEGEEAIFHLSGGGKLRGEDAGDGSRMGEGYCERW